MAKKKVAKKRATRAKPSARGKSRTSPRKKIVAVAKKAAAEASKPGRIRLPRPDDHGEGWA